MKFKADQSEQKLRGAYYTPIDIAKYICDWISHVRPIKILEPSCGDGIFIQALHDVGLKNIQIQVAEIDRNEADKAVELSKGLDIPLDIHLGDFLDWATPVIIHKHEQFDAVIGNPPFIRYQFLEKSFQDNIEFLFKSLDLKFSKHTNAWVPFVLAGVSLLKPGGRLGMVIPSELINVMHSQPLRQFLGVECSKILIIDPKDIWFEDTLQGAIILLAEKKLTNNCESLGVAIKQVEGWDFLNIDPQTEFEKAKPINGKTVSGKWTKAILNEKEIHVLEKTLKNKMVHRFSDIAKVDVGIVTGANDFFLVKDSVVEEFDLRPYSHPMFGRSEHCKGVIYDQNQFNYNKTSGHPTNFIYLSDEYEVLPDKVKKYVLLGELQDLHTRYKCRIRKPWYKVPSVYSTNIGMLKRAHDVPRLIFNELGAYTTDTAYRVESKGVAPELLVYCFMNPLTALMAELEGRSYGGGVLELVPSEIEKLYLPLPDINFNLRELDKDVRTKDFDEILLGHGQKILLKIGLSKDEIKVLFTAWSKLKNRRQRK